MRADHAKLRHVGSVENELSDSELEKVVGGGAKPLQANANRFDPYKTFRFRVS
jgi:bacteriocin-like protein